jgi:hypothetical protein
VADGGSLPGEDGGLRKQIEVGIDHLTHLWFEHDVADPEPPRGAHRRRAELALADDSLRANRLKSPPRVVPEAAR